MSRLIVSLLALLYSIIYTVKPEIFLERIKKRYPQLDEDGSGEKKPILEVNTESIRKARIYGCVLIAISGFATLFTLYKMYLA